MAGSGPFEISMQVACVQGINTCWPAGTLGKDMPPGDGLFLLNIYVALASPLVGSAAAAVPARLARGGTWAGAPSTCEACGRRLGLLELVPVLSWLLQRGKCRGCGAAISPAYPIIELAAVGIAVWAWFVTPAYMFVPTCVFGWLLLVLAAIDFRTFRLPDVLNAALLLCGLMTAQLFYPERMLEQLAGAALGFGGLLAVEFAYRALRKRDGLGRGDSKLLGAMGVWIGPVGIAPCVFIAATAAILFVLINVHVRKRQLTGDMAIPFGPFLAAGGWVVWVTGSVPL
jgi:leader peptidase (prepilin peptidase)/N-methyltransferase